ncbi:hypothetical protein EUGRSUZ_C00086 [Eucalyptus grandis]|uniref:Uncharacterized protein n=2 Tax=Eucalyptus grandis TaxID=71139 RepID=A0ACC3L904_EUCGR|nr:hypothetical protein EUGRSUZ_C00086 [Eucalyptus grandis]
MRVKYPARSTIQFNSIKITGPSLANKASANEQFWMNDSHKLKPCWNISAPITGQQPSQGYITFSLTEGPEYHVSQIAVAVLVARELGATLMLPDIKGRKPGDKRTLQLQTEVWQLVNQIIGKLKTSGGESNGQFIAVDLRVEALQGNSCQRSGSVEMKFCYHAQDFGEILTKIGISTETPIYVTRSRWHKNLKPLKDIFPKTYTKEFLMPPDKKEMFVSSASCELEKVMGFHLASESDIFVPASADLFYATVAGSRIASGRTRILVPTSTSSLSHISPYISEKKHYAYSCFY